MAFANADCDKIAIENPVGVMSTIWRKPDQIVQPWQFAEDEQDEQNLVEKTTCFWTKGLKPLVQNITVKPEIPYHEWITHDGKKNRQTIWYYKTRCLPHAERAKAASVTFPGIARAMAEQWAGVCEDG